MHLTCLSTKLRDRFCRLNDLYSNFGDDATLEL